MSRYSDTNQLPESVKSILRDAFVFRGRARRTDGLTYYLAVLLLVMALGVPTILFTDSDTIEEAWPVIGLAFQFPLIAWFVRRVHDYGMTGWAVVPFFVWTVIGSPLVTVVGADPVALHHNLAFRIANPVIAIAFICAIFWKPDEGSNRFGPNPRLDASADEFVSEEL
jgi:uncharacterized membrane protein YhaH (DUF805 family)